MAANDTKLLYEEVRARRGFAVAHTSSTRLGTTGPITIAKLEPVVEIFQGARPAPNQPTLHS